MYDEAEKQQENTKDTFPSTVHKFKPGQSGNPAGRPRKEVCLTSLVKQYLSEDAEVNGKKLLNKDGSPKTWEQVLAASIVHLAAKGNATALAQLWERLDGKVPQPLEHSGIGGGPIEITAQRDRLRKIIEDPALREAAIEIGKRLASAEVENGKDKIKKD